MAVGWTLFGTLNSRGGGPKASVSVLSSQGQHFGSASIHLNQGSSPRLDRPGMAMTGIGSDYAADARAMAAAACWGL